MEITTGIALIGSGLSIMMALIAIVKFFDLRRQTVLDEGRRHEVIEQLRRDLDHAYEKVHSLEGDSKKMDRLMAEMKTDIKHILTAIQEIKEKLE